MASASVKKRLDYKQTSESRIIADILGTGLRVGQANQLAARIVEKGTADKLNPYVTDAGKCQRAVGYSLRNEPKSKPDSVDSLIAFGIGHATEDMAAEAFELAGCAVSREVRIAIPTKPLPVTGRIDFLIEIPSLIDAMIELKTTNSRAMHLMVEKGELGRAEHRRQLNLYLHASQLGLVKIEGQQRKWDRGFLTYCVKDSTRGESSILTWEQEYDQEQALSDLAALSIVAEASKLGILPAIPFEKSQWWPCHYCPYEDTCWGRKER